MAAKARRGLNKKITRLRSFLKRKLKHANKVVRSKNFAKKYALASVAVLLVTTIFWALLSANLQQNNSDQLVDSYLFENLRTFHQASFPAAHTMLLKWPIFLLISWSGTSGFVFSFITILMVLLTIGILATVIYRIDKRPIMFGTFCLALASTTLLIPAQPYSGGLLPVNMAMVATRNLEYVVYLASLLILIRSPRFRSRGFWLAAGLLSLLIASDRLFLIISLGGALVASAFYYLSRHREMTKLSLRWLGAGVAGAVLALIILRLIDQSGLTHIVNQAKSGPFGVAHRVKTLALGVIYGVLSLFTNFGANPAFDSTIIRHIPSVALARLTSLSGPTYLINFLIMDVGFFAAFKIFMLNRLKPKSKSIIYPTSLPVILIWTSIVAFVAFVLSDHYFAVDSRYLTIVFFSFFISAALFLGKKKLQPAKIVAIGSVIAIGILLGIIGALRNYNADKNALANVAERNLVIGQALAHHPENILVGDYWRVLPIKQMAGKNLSSVTVMPLDGCEHPRDILSSQNWQTDLHNHSFAYILTLQKGLAGFPACSREQTILNYGRPSASVVIDGTVDQPKEVLLFYDHGMNITPASQTNPAARTGTILPITLAQFSNSLGCSNSSIMNVVAHQDDDLLFMNPDLLHEIRAGKCIRSVYVTAGDAGSDKFYWLSRETGSEAAYSYMLGSSAPWVQRNIELPGHQFISIASPRGDQKISLVFMRLPDGNLHGEGFSTSNYESLARLKAGKISAMHSVDGQSTYSSEGLSSALLALIRTFQPSEIQTQATYLSGRYPDHSDHMAVSRYTQQAAKNYEYELPVKLYIGYPIHGMPQNVFGEDLRTKETAFLAYSKFDTHTCDSSVHCHEKSTYGFYLDRQYWQSQ